jgi:hypothetical protein
MGVTMSGQVDRSKKAPVDRIARPPGPPPRTLRGLAGNLWQRKMHSLALRLSKRRGRRHASGAPMKHG